MEDTDLNYKNNNPGAVQFGNFINYYQFHPPENRISLLPTDLWEISLKGNNSCTILDVGCNAGDLTLALYNFFHKTIGISDCNILGVDIDPTLIKRACEKNTKSSCSFRCLNIMSESIEDHEVISEYLKSHHHTKFDIIFCFSVTMWIHLNSGDDGLKTFLRKVSDLSNFLVIEPQPWKCYRTAVKRLKSSNCEFPKFKELKIRQDIEKEIENYIVENCDYVKITESTRTEWDRKLLFFKRKEVKQE